MPILSETVIEAFGQNYKISRVSYSGSSSTFLVDQSATGVAVISPVSGGPSVSIGSADSNFEKTVTLAAGGASGTVTVIITHSGTVASTKP